MKNCLYLIMMFCLFSSVAVAGDDLTSTKGEGIEDQLLKQRQEKLLLSQKRLDAWSGQSPSYVEEKEHEFEIGTETSYIKYKEKIVNVVESGIYYGVYGVYNYRPQIRNILAPVINVYHFDVHLNYGQVKYDDGSNTYNQIRDYLFEPRFWLGHDINFSDHFRVTPYFGLAYRFLYDTLSDAGAGGYDRRSQYFYLPIGFETKLQANNKLSIGFKSEYDFFIMGNQDSYLSDADAGYPDISNKQKKGYGIRGSLSINLKTDNYNFLVEPYIRYWHIQDSEISTATGSVFRVTGYEPENTSTESGVRLGVQF